ncbi:MAG: energy-coupled thiamine transporter ThiT [Oscillospiraceae bacterium]
METTKMSKTRILVECALMIALSTVLSYVKVFELPQGGSITLCSMLPLVLISFRHGAKWGLFTGFVHSILQILLGLKSVMICPTVLAMIGCILLDYVIAFTVQGSACIFAKKFKNQILGIAVGTATVGVLRFGCSFLSGILIWGEYAQEGWPVWLHSLVYNGSYMLPEIVLTTVVAVLMGKFVLPRLKASSAV